eukprot:comp18911_c0_seq1/m.21063 comp18911_c0_seq1/g.21063  ORF comp18911_c0_seq1/g.21063 comp18911_c0_seq1/m.21063 type:complete len:315 (-) comp18911_c0_seq1:1435-2379(-)
MARSTAPCATAQTRHARNPSRTTNSRRWTASATAPTACATAPGVTSGPVKTPLCTTARSIAPTVCVLMRSAGAPSRRTSPMARKTTSSTRARGTAATACATAQAAASMQARSLCLWTANASAPPVFVPMRTATCPSRTENSPTSLHRETSREATCASRACAPSASALWARTTSCAERATASARTAAAVAARSRCVRMLPRPCPRRRIPTIAPSAAAVSAPTASVVCGARTPARSMQASSTARTVCAASAARPWLVQGQRARSATTRARLALAASVPAATVPWHSRTALPLALPSSARRVCARHATSLQAMCAGH